MAEIQTVTPPKQPPAPGAWTYDDYLALPDDGTRYEIIEGVLYAVKAPNIDHQFAISELHRQMANYVTEQGLGYVLTAPFEVHLSKTTRPVQPDVLFINMDNWPGSGVKFFEGVPDLVIEVISPSSIRTDQYIKFSAYEQAGIPEYWIANPISRAVEVFTLSGGEYALKGLYVDDQLIKSDVLTDLQIVTSQLFMAK